MTSGAQWQEGGDHTFQFSPRPLQVEVICASMSSSLGSIGGFVAGEVDVVQVGLKVWVGMRV